VLKLRLPVSNPHNFLSGVQGGGKTSLGEEEGSNIIAVVNAIRKDPRLYRLLRVFHNVYSGGGRKMRGKRERG